MDVAAVEGVGRQVTERDLWQRCRGGDEAARTALIEQYEHLVAMTRAKRLGNAPQRFSDDLEGAGRLALVKAVDRYDPARGVQFTSFAITLIWGAMQEWLRSEDWAPRQVRDKIRAGLPVHTWELVSLESILYQDEGSEPLTVLNTLSDWEDTPDVIVPKRLEAGVVACLVQCLPKRERRLMEAHYWEGLPHGRVGERLGLSESRVHQLHEEALSLLKGWLERRNDLDARQAVL